MMQPKLLLLLFCNLLSQPPHCKQIHMRLFSHKWYNLIFLQITPCSSTIQQPQMVAKDSFFGKAWLY